MPLNPIQLGEQVIKQFQRYLLTYFPIADRWRLPVSATQRVGSV